MTTTHPERLSRREALARMTAMASSLTLVGCVYPDAPADTLEGAPWPELALNAVEASGYGTDPVLITPQPAPWPRTLAPSQLQLVIALGDRLCPGAAAAQVADVIDEWVSAPYPDQRADRALLLPGFVWLDADCTARYGAPFARLRTAQQEAVCTALDATPQRTPQSGFFRRFRALAAGAYFSSPQGVRELGYQGNTPIAGAYPGPSPAALEHLQTLLDELGLGSDDHAQ